jgi:hypothetical protein
MESNISKDVSELKTKNDIEIWLRQMSIPVSKSIPLIDKNGNSWKQCYGFKRYYFLHCIFKSEMEPFKYSFDVREMTETAYLDWEPNSGIYDTLEELYLKVAEKYYKSWNLKE